MTDPTRQTALVTGGAGGIGAALIRRFADRGANVVVADVNPDGSILADEIGGVFVHTDVTDPTGNQKAMDTAVDRFGRLDIVVLNAGVGEPRYLDGFDPEAYRAMAAVNFDGVIYGVHAAVQAFTGQGSGAILVTASLAGISSSPFNPLYSATKHGAVGLVRSLAPAIADQGITINALCPTFIDTPILGEAAPYLKAMGLAVLEPDRVADVAEIVLAGGGTGQAWPVVPHGEPEPFPFHETPTLMVDPNQPPPEVPT